MGTEEGVRHRGIDEPYIGTGRLPVTYDLLKVVFAFRFSSASGDGRKSLPSALIPSVFQKFPSGVNPPVNREAVSDGLTD